jgi:hypothetical protein
MYKDKEVKKNVKNIFLSMCDVKMFLTFDKISQQPENCENRNDPDLVQAFLKKWWVESDFKAPNPSLSLQFKDSLICSSISPLLEKKGIYLVYLLIYHTSLYVPSM